MKRRACVKQDRNGVRPRQNGHMIANTIQLFNKFEQLYKEVAAIHERRLVPLLPQRPLPEHPLNMLYPSHRHPSTIHHRQDLPGLLPRLSPADRSNLLNRRCPVKVPDIRREISGARLRYRHALGGYQQSA